MSDEKRKNGRFTERPEGAAALFNPESGRKAAVKRWEDKEVRNRDALVRYVAEETGREVTYEEALDYTVLSPQFREALKGKTAAAKLILQILKEMPEGADAKVHIDKRQINVFNYNAPVVEARAYLEELKDANHFLQAAIIEKAISEASDGEIIDVELPLDDKN